MPTARGLFEQPGAATLLCCFLLAAAVALFSVSCESLPAARAPISVAAAGPADEPVIRVRIARGVSRTRISGAELVLVKDDTSVPAVMAAPVEVSAEEGTWTLRDAAGRSRECSPGQRIHLTSADPVAPGTQPSLRVGETRYIGGIGIAFPASGGASIDLVNELPMEAYVGGVLAGELYADWPEEAYRAQAVAARSYALHLMARARARGSDFDIEGSPVNQAYAGAEVRGVATDAAAATRGRVLTWGGEVLRAYYSSTCGGRPASAADQWSVGKGFEFNQAGPIQAVKRGHACAGSPLYRWQVERTVDDVSARLRAWGQANGSRARTLGTVASVGVAERNPAGRPSKYTVRDAAGRTVKLNAEQLRLALNFAGKGCRAPESSRQVRSGDLDVQVRAGRATISGRGFGHGVGLCQFCARQKAVDGETYREMLDQFYPGARIERLY